MFNNCINLEKVCTKGWFVDDSYQNTISSRQYNCYAIIEHTKLIELDLSFVTFNYVKDNSIHGYPYKDAFINTPSTLTYIRYGSGWFNATLHNVAKTYICTYVNLTKKHYDDMIEDLPDLNGVKITNDSYKTLIIGENFNDWDKLPQTSRDAILAKGWFISKE